MNSERNLLKRINVFVLDKHLTISDVAYFFEMETEINKTFLEVRELLAQPEQEPEPLLAETKIEWYGKGFRQGVNEFAPPKPLTEDVIYALDKEGVVENMDDHQVRYVIRWIRRVEKAHGIGGGE
jgi:hypothetical protein